MKNRSYRAQAAPEHDRLVQSSLWRTSAALGGDWVIIAGAACASAYFSASYFLYVASVLLIASRQHALLVLMHEGAHGHLCRSQTVNLFLSDCFTAWPFGMSTERYRVHHWRHHQFTNTAEDPDWGRKAEHPAWQFPKQARRFWRDFLPYAWGLGVRELWFAHKVVGVGFRSSPVSAFYYAGALAILAYTHGWAFFAQYWLVPAFTVLPVLMKVRSIVEHLGLRRTSELDSSRNILGSPLGRFFFGPHENAFHLIHHLYPQVPWHRVRALREVLRRDAEFAARAHESHGYFWGSRSVYGELTNFTSESGHNDRIHAA